jgi:Ca2+:H+ antiporter
MLFSLRPHRELFASVSHAAEEEKPSPLALSIGALVIVTLLVALLSEIFAAANVQALDAAGRARTEQDDLTDTRS